MNIFFKFKNVLSTATHNLLGLLCVLSRNPVPGLRFTPMQVVYTRGPMVLNILYVIYLFNLLVLFLAPNNPTSQHFPCDIHVYNLDVCMRGVYRVWGRGKGAESHHLGK